MNWIAQARELVALALVIIYIVERVTALNRAWRSRTGALMETIEQEERIHSTAQASTPTPPVLPTAKELLPKRLRGDAQLDALLDDMVQPKARRRVNRLRRVAGFAMRLLPLVSRFADRRGADL